MLRQFSSDWRKAPFLVRLARDTRGNTLALMAAALIPILAMVGGGVDISRGYLAQSRLQQACDAGVLAARKRLGPNSLASGKLPSAAKEAGDQFFEVNFENGMYGTNGRTFRMTVDSSHTVSGAASVIVPTTIMQLFGYSSIALAADCEARLNFSDTDVMMVLDVTGSMGETNVGDTKTRLESLKSTVQSFYSQLSSATQPGTRVRYGFLPYSTNVNVGHLLHEDWLADEWSYNSRQAKLNGKKIAQPVYETKLTEVSGSVANGASYASSYCPGDALTTSKLEEWTDATGWTHVKYLENGSANSCAEGASGNYIVTPKSYLDHIYIASQRQIGTKQIDDASWYYDKFSTDVTFATSGNPTKKFKIGGTPVSPTNVTVGYQGCVEERDTYQISDYTNVDLDKAKDLDLDLVPDPGDITTQWKPMLHELSYERQMGADANRFTVAAATSKKDYWNAAAYGWAPCPPAAMKLRELNATQLSSYLSTLYPYGNTYHDIGMIWGGRLLSPNGIFAAENASRPGQNTTRHLIFLTDGQTAPRDVSYGTYGIEPLDRRRWQPSSPLTLTQTVEKRFAFACQEVKKRNITVWVVAFGTNMTTMLSDCAGPGHHFKADNAAELEAAFSAIVRQMGNLRITK